MKKKFIYLLLFCAMLGVGVVFAFGHMATRPTPSQIAQLADNEQELTLKTSDGIRIAASFFPAVQDDAPVILMLHGNGANRRQFQGHVRWLNEAGFAAMAIDFRGHGESQAEAKSFGYFESRDALAAVTWIKANRPKAKIGLIGVSLGGAAALLNHNGALPVDAMILKAVYPDIDRAIRNRVAARGGSLLSALVAPLLTYQSLLRFGVWPSAISPINAANKFSRPVFVIGGEEDSYTPPSESEQLANAFKGKHRLWIVPGLEHDELSDLDNEPYRQRVIKFFREEMR